MFEGKYYLGGIVSSSLYNSFDGCDVSNYAIFTNILKMASWVEYITGQSNNQQPQVESRNDFLDEPPEITCGVMSAASPLLQGGKRSQTDQWPWAVAVYKINFLGQNEDFTTGTLLSNRHVFTEPFALEVLNADDNSIPLSQNLRVLLGIHDLNHLTYETETSYVEKVIIHPNYRSGFPIIANLAILVMKEAVKFSKTIAPICVWEEPSNVEGSQGQNAFAVGFGIDNRNLRNADKSKIKKHTIITLGTIDDCVSHYKLYVTATSNFSQYFCVKQINDNGQTCIGDSFTLYMKKNDRWFLYAINCQILFKYGTRTCGDGTASQPYPAMYETISSFSKWIKSSLANS
jgi:Trypsin